MYNFLSSFVLFIGLVFCSINTLGLSSQHTRAVHRLRHSRAPQGLSYIQFPNRQGLLSGRFIIREIQFEIRDSEMWPMCIRHSKWPKLVMKYRRKTRAQRLEAIIKKLWQQCKWSNLNQKNTSIRNEFM